MKELFNKFFKTKKGEVVIGQWPNFPLWAWLVLNILSFIPLLSSWKQSFNSLGSMFLFVWSYLELTSGVNYFRKLIGFLIFLIIIVSIL